MLWKLLAVTLLTLGLTFAAACGDDDDDDNGQSTDTETTAPADDTDAPAGETDAPDDDGPTTVELSAGDFAFDMSTISAAPGSEVTIELTNTGAAPHNFSVDELELSADVAAGESTTFTFTMPEGETRFYCAVHPTLMEGNLVPGDAVAVPNQGDSDSLSTRY